MNPRDNPFAPGAGSPPPELAGRQAIREKVDIAVARACRGRHSRSILMIGLRGVGKTVLLEHMCLEAETSGVHAIPIESLEERSLPGLLTPRLRLALLELSRKEASKDLAIRALRALAGFVTKLKVTYGDIEVGVDFEVEQGLADNGNLDADLTTLLVQAGMAARAAKTALVLFVDELHVVPETQLGALIMALHRCAQKSLPVLLVGAGLPHLVGQTGRAKSYAERLFEFPQVGALSPEDAQQALVVPCEQEGVRLEAAALAQILAETQGYPYFLQEWGKHAWNVAENDLIRLQDVKEASVLAVSSLDESFFRVRFDRLTPKEKIYLRAMADLGKEPIRSGDIAERLGRTVQSLGPLRSSLIAKGMIWSPTHGDNAFTVPLFGDFLERRMPEDSWQSADT